MIVVSCLALALAARRELPSSLPHPERAPWAPQGAECTDQDCCRRECEKRGWGEDCVGSCAAVVRGVSTKVLEESCQNVLTEADAAEAQEACVNQTEGDRWESCQAGVLLGVPPIPAYGGVEGAPEQVQPNSFFWRMGINGTSYGKGFSWYTRIFKLFEEGHPLDNQMGMGGTWLAANGVTYDRCPCPIDHMGSCCLTKQCSCSGWLFESFEGGPGYWQNQLPTTVSKWRVGDSVGCYSYYTGSPLFQFGQWEGHDCDHMGLAQVSNRMLMAPDGVTFDVEGMLGVAYAHTPFGKVNETDSRNFWTIVIDSENYQGPLAYFMPEFWKLRARGDENRTANIMDFGDCPQLSQGGCAFEWNTLHNFRASNGDFKLPAMSVPYKGGRTVLMMNNRAYNDSDFADPLEHALQTGTLNTSALFAKGERHPCRDGAEGNAGYSIFNRTQVTVGTLKTSVESDECLWQVTLNNESCASDGDCWMPRYVRPDSEGKYHAIDPSEAPVELREQQFPTKKIDANYSQLGSDAARSCLSSPGPSDPKLYCVQTLQKASALEKKSATWIAYKWYRFVDQPGLQQANLTPDQKDFMQKRIEQLHQMMADSKGKRWIPAGKAVDEGLAVVDAAALVTPPKGLEIGYVPIPVFEGFSKPDGCSDPPSAE